jgi:RND superfamily putative drug exporter
VPSTSGSSRRAASPPLPPVSIFVFGGFLLSDGRVIKLIGLGLSSAIFIDAFILRTAMVPGVMHLAGKANWCFPKWLDKITPPRLSIEGPSGPKTRARETEPVG